VSSGETFQHFYIESKRVNLGRGICEAVSNNATLQSAHVSEEEMRGFIRPWSNFHDDCDIYLSGSVQ